MEKNPIFHAWKTHTWPWYCGRKVQGPSLLKFYAVLGSFWYVHTANVHSEAPKFAFWSLSTKIGFWGVILVCFYTTVHRHGQKMGLAGSPKEVNPLETHTRGGLVLATLSTRQVNPCEIYGWGGLVLATLSTEKENPSKIYGKSSLVLFTLITRQVNPIWHIWMV